MSGVSSSRSFCTIEDNAMTNEELVRTACRVIWTEGDLSRVREFYADDFLAHGTSAGPGWGSGAAGVEELARNLRAAFPDYNETVEDLIAEDDKVVVRLTVRGTNEGALPNVPATGKAVAIADISILRSENGKIAEQGAATDNLSLLMQLGIVDFPA
jgi:steroid delta-isomerase-like uncharacterized protein